MNPRFFFDYTQNEWVSFSSSQDTDDDNSSMDDDNSSTDDEDQDTDDDNSSMDDDSTSTYEWDPVVHLYPGTDRNVTDLAVNFRWQRLLKQDSQGQYSAAQNFRLQVDDDTSFGSPVIDVNQSSPKPSYPSDAEAFARWSYISYMPTDLLPAGTYHWRVRAEDGNGSDWSTATSFTVNDDHTASPLVYTLSPESPLFTFDMFFGTGTELLLEKIPTIHAAFAESVRPHVAYAIHCEAIGQDPTHDDGFDGTFLDMIRPMAESGVPLLIKSGGPDKDFQQFADLAEVEEIFETYPNVIGLLLGETFWDYIDSDDNATIRDQHLQWYKRSFLLATKHGRLVIWGNGNDEHFVWDRFLGEENNANPWMSPDEFEAIAPNLVIAPKNNIPFGHFHAESTVMGAWLAGRAQNWGVWSEGWAWGSIGYDKLFGEQLVGDLENPDFSSMPYNLWIQMKLAGLSQGATVFHFGGESSVVEWGEYDPINDRFVLDEEEYLPQSTAFWDMSGNEHPALQRYVTPFMKAVVEHGLIPSETEVLDKVKLAVATTSPETDKGSALDYGSYAPLFLATNQLPGYVSISEAQEADPEVEYYELTPNANRRELLRDNGRHYATPILPYPVNSLSDDTTVIALSEVGSSESFQALIDPLYPETSTGSAWVVQVGHRLYVSNGLENTDQAQDFSIPVEGVGTLSGTIQPHSYLLATFKEDEIWFMANADGKGAYTDDRSTSLQLTLSSKPTWDDTASNAAITWDNGTLTLKLDHQNGSTEVVLTP